MEFTNKESLIEYWTGGKEYKETQDEGVVMTQSDPTRTPEYLTNLFGEIQNRYNSYIPKADKLRIPLQTRHFPDWMKVANAIHIDYGCMSEDGTRVLADAKMKRYNPATKRGWVEPGVFMYAFVDDVCQFLDNEHSKSGQGKILV